jgi:hypothetical protein
MQQPFEASDGTWAQAARARADGPKKLRAVQVGQVLVISQIRFLEDVPEQRGI